MNPGVHVNSLAALDRFRAALCAFHHEASQALSSIQSEVQGFVEWLKHDQLAYWKHEIRKRGEQVAEAKADLHRCLAATIDPHRTPSCYQEKKLLVRAKQRLDEAESRLAAVRRWIPIIEQAVFEYQARAEPLATSLAAGIPRALGDLDRSVDQIVAYLELSSSTSDEP